MQQSGKTPKTIRQLTPDDRNKLFGKFAFEPAPSKDNPERIKIIDSWARDNLIKVAMPTPIVAGVKTAWFHEKVGDRFLELLNEWDNARLLEDVLTWNGSYAARFIRGSETSLSAHAWGSAFDINVPWNPLNRPAATEGTRGSVMRLVGIAEKNGWVWGGRFARCDGQHFEVGKL